MWTNEVLNREIYDLTRQALHADDSEKIRQILWRFEEIVQDGYALPIQKAYLLWESKKLSDDRLVIFLEDCYKWSYELKDEAMAKDLRDKVVRWAFQMLWRLTRPNR